MSIYIKTQHFYYLANDLSSDCTVGSLMLHLH